MGTKSETKRRFSNTLKWVWYARFYLFPVAALCCSGLESFWIIFLRILLFSKWEARTGMQGKVILILK